MQRMSGNAVAAESESALRFKATSTVACMTVLAGVHWSLWWALREVDSPFATVELIELGGLNVSLRPMLLRPGPAFSALPENSIELAVARGADACIFFVFYLALLAFVPPRYKGQVIAVAMFGGAALAQFAEGLFAGGVRVYFNVGFGQIYWPTFNIYALVIYSTVACLYGRVLLIFFRVLPGYKRGIESG